MHARPGLKISSRARCFGSPCCKQAQVQDFVATCQAASKCSLLRRRGPAMANCLEKPLQQNWGCRCIQAWTLHSSQKAPKLSVWVRPHMRIKVIQPSLTSTQQQWWKRRLHIDGEVRLDRRSAILLHGAPQLAARMGQSPTCLSRNPPSQLPQRIHGALGAWARRHMAGGIRFEDGGQGFNVCQCERLSILVLECCRHGKH